MPPYAHVPGRTPHPTRDPRGHSFGAEPAPPVPPEPDDWRSCHLYLRGIDLFNEGYYWEAHEAWEAVWNACGRAGATAELLKGLIALAAAGVKARAGIPEGARRHGARARRIFRGLGEADTPGAADRRMGLRLEDLVGLARRFAEGPVRGSASAPNGPISGMALQPREAAAVAGRRRPA